jgi:hypothetical protein
MIPHTELRRCAIRPARALHAEDRSSVGAEPLAGSPRMTPVKHRRRRRWLSRVAAQHRRLSRRHHRGRAFNNDLRFPPPRVPGGDRSASTAPGSLPTSRAISRHVGGMEGARPGEARAALERVQAVGVGTTADQLAHG